MECTNCKCSSDKIELHQIGPKDVPSNQQVWMCIICIERDKPDIFYNIKRQNARDNFINSLIDKAYGHV